MIDRSMGSNLEPRLPCRNVGNKHDYRRNSHAYSGFFVDAALPAA